MAAEVPGWCRHCGELLEHADRTQGRARTYCSDRCRQAFHRSTALRRQLVKEIGLQPAQTERLLALFRVTPRT